MRARTTHSSGAWQAIVRRACMAAGVKREAARVVAQIELIYRGSLEVNAGAARLADYVGVSERTIRRAAEVACDAGFWESLHSRGQRLHLHFAATERLLAGQPEAIWAEGLSEYPEQTSVKVTDPTPDTVTDVQRNIGHGDRPTPDTVTYPTPDTVTYPPPDPGHGDRGGSDTVTGGSGHGDRPAEANSISKQQQQQHPKTAPSSSVPGSVRDPGAAAAAAEAPPEEPDRDPLGELIRSGLAALGVDPGSPFGGEVAEALLALELPAGVTRTVAVERILDRAGSQANPGGGLRSAIGGGYLAEWAEDPAEREDPRQANDPHAAPVQAEESAPGGWDIELERLACEFVFEHPDPRAAESARRGAELRARRSEWGSVDGVLFAQESQIQALSEHVEPQVHAGWGIDGWRRWLGERTRERGGEPSAAGETPEPQNAGERLSGDEAGQATDGVESAASLNGHERNGVHVEPSATEHDPFAGVESEADADAPWSSDASQSAFGGEEREPDYMRALREGLDA